MDNEVRNTTNWRRGSNTLYVVAVVIVVIVVAGVYLINGKNTNQENQSTNNQTKSDQDALVDSQKFCNTDFDCGLLTCGGCFANAYLRTAPPDLACRTYAEGYVCSCVSNQCQAVSTAEATKAYTSGQFGFSVRYPKEWTVIEADDGADFGRPVIDGGVSRVSNGFSINVYPSTVSETLSAAYERVTGIDLESVPSVKQENMAIADEPVIILRDVPGEISSDDVILMKNKRIFLIQIFDMTEEHQTAMLESFAFSAPGD